MCSSPIPVSTTPDLVTAFIAGAESMRKKIDRILAALNDRECPECGWPVEDRDSAISCTHCDWWWPT